jgi:hypothetical protein
MRITAPLLKRLWEPVDVVVVKTGVDLWPRRACAIFREGAQEKMDEVHKSLGKACWYKIRPFEAMVSDDTLRGIAKHDDDVQRAALWLIAAFIQEDSILYKRGSRDLFGPETSSDSTRWSATIIPGP